MAADTPTTVPAEITQGDTLKFQLGFSDYPASDGWVLSFAFSSAGFQFSFSSTAASDGTSHLVSTPTAQVTPDRYQGIGRVTYNGETFTVWRGELLVRSAFSEITDGRSHARKVLDAINLMLENTAGNEIGQSVIEGESLTWKSVDDLLKLRAHYAALVRAEEDAARIALGLGSRNRILTRFLRPR